MEKARRLNKRPERDTGMGGMAVYDFKTMYPTIPPQDLKARVGSLIREVFQKRNAIVRHSQNRQCQWWPQQAKSLMLGNWGGLEAEFKVGADL